MRRSRRLLLHLAGALAVASVLLPALAASETSPAVEAVNKPGTGAYAEEHHAWSPEQATVSAGGAVIFRNPGMVAHGVRWIGGPATPNCSSGVPVGTEASASGVQWSGTCTFTQAGTYNFYCTVHGPEMTGRIIVSAAGPTNPTPVQSEGSPLAGSASDALKLAASQRGRSVRGSLKLSQAGAGARLEVDLLAGGASLAKASHPAQVRVGRLVRSSLIAGKLPFTVALDARAGHALASRRRLALTVKVQLTPSHGSAVAITRSVVLHA